MYKYYSLLFLIVASMIMPSEQQIELASFFHKQDIALLTFDQINEKHIKILA